MQVVFGTDGVRDVANTKLTPEIAFLLGRIGTQTLLDLNSGGRKKVVIGMDPRISSPMLEAAMASGVASLGVDVLRARVVPTPAVARLVIELEADLGIVISASHNPAEYNGIKFFDKEGFKLSDSIEREIERNIAQFQQEGEDKYPRPSGEKLGRLIDLDLATERYIDYVIKIAETDLSGLHVVLDCANGAAFFTSPEILRRLNAKVTVMSAEPDGININNNCGSTHPERLCAVVKELRADFGLAHDGDADRVIACDHMGNIVDGDDIMAICAKAAGYKAIVATNYSNMGLIKALSETSCEVIMAESGDRYVLDEMRKRSIILGGEKSGHVIFLDVATTGDGIITGVRLAKTMVDSGKTLKELASSVQHFPQVMKNVHVEDKSAYRNNPEICEAIAKAQEELGQYGRIFVRASGTEPVIRVMVEAEDEAQVEEIAQRIASMISDN